MTVALIRIDAKTAGGSDSPVYLASHDLPELCHLDGEEWLPAIARKPTLRYDWFGGEFYGTITAPSAQFAVARHAVSGFDALYYADARVRVWAGDLGTTADNSLALDLDFLTQTYQSDDGVAPAGIGGLDLRFDGVIEAEPRVDGAIAEFSAAVDDKWLDKPLLDVYAGTDGIEGPEELTGLPKFLTFGAAKFCAGQLIDVDENVYQVHDGAVEGITAAYDKLCSLGTTTGDYADLAALIAASIPAGSWGTCKALGLVRLGAPADGLVSFDVSGGNTGSYVRKPGAIIDRVVDIVGGSANATSLTALDTARAYNLAIQVTEQTTAREVVQEIAGSVGAVAFVGWTGGLYVVPIAYATAAGVLATDGSGDHPVGDIVRLPIGPPFWRLATYAEPTWAVHDRTDIATEYVIRGEYDADRVYRLDDAVSADDGRVFVYINATPGAGNAPPTAPDTSNAHWALFGSATEGATPAQVADIAQALNDASNAQATADGKIVTFSQSSVPTSEGEGDLWYKTDTQKWYRAAIAGADAIATGEWELREDGGIGDALSAAAGAQATADGKVTTFVSETEPTADAIGDLWFKASTGELRRWNGTAWGDPLVDLTAVSQRTIVPQFPSIEIKQGEAGHTGDRTVTHSALKGTSTITGGTWSLPSQSLGAGSATINSSTGTVTLSGIVQSGSYTIRYTHTDGTATELAVNVTYVPTPASETVSARTGREVATAGTINNNDWQTILTLTVNSAPAGRVNFGAANLQSYLLVVSGSNTASFEARITLDGTTTLRSVAAQSVLSAGVVLDPDFSDLFVGSYAVSSGNRTFRIELRRTSGVGTITETDTVLEATVIAT